MLASARQLRAAGLEPGTVRGAVLLLVAGAAQPAVGVRVGEAGQAVSPHAFRELTHLVHKGRVSGFFVLPPGARLRHACCAARNFGLFCCSWPRPRNCPPGSGSGKSGTPWARMHCAYLTACSWPVAGAVSLLGGGLEGARGVGATKRTTRGP